MTATYTVRPGDTLWALAQKYGTSVQAIAQASGISNPNRISVGQRISIPAAPAADVPLPRPRPSMEASGLPIMSGATANGSVVARPVLLASGNAGAGTGAGGAALPLMASSVGGAASPSLTDVLASRYSSVAPSSPDASSYYGGDIASSLGGSNQSLDFVQPEISSIPAAQSSALQTALNTKAASMVPTLSASGAAYAGTDPPGQANLGPDLATGLIQQREGFAPTAYQDSDGRYRIGYGSDTWMDASGGVHQVTPSTTVTAAQAAADLARRVPDYQQGIVNLVGQDAWNNLSPGAQAALTSVAYNYGSLSGLPSLVRAAQSGDDQAIAAAIAARGVDNGGINAARRQAEAGVVLANPTPPMDVPNGPTDQPPLPRPRPVPLDASPSGWLGNDIGSGPSFAALSAPTFDANVRSTPPATDFQLIGSPEWNAWEQSLPKSQPGQPTLTMPSFGGGGGQGDQGPTTLPIMAGAAQPSYSPPTTAYTVRQMQVDNPAYLQYIAAQNADPIGAGPGSFADLQSMFGAPGAPAAPPRYITQSVRVPIMQASAPVVATPPTSDGGYFAGSPQAAMLQAAVSPMAGHGYDASEAGARSLAAMNG